MNLSKASVNFVISASIALSMNVVSAEKINLTCKAAEFTIISDPESTLEPGQLRLVDPLLAPYVDSSTFSTRITTECRKNDKKTKDCLSLNNSVFCQNPKEAFRVRSVRDDNSIVMVENRCNGGFIKYVLSDYFDEDLVSVYMEDRMFFKMKNQIHSTQDYSSYLQPVLVLSPSKDGAELAIKSFEADEHLLSNDAFSTLASLKLTPSKFEVGDTEKISLRTACSSIIPPESTLDQK